MPVDGEGKINLVLLSGTVVESRYYADGNRTVLTVRNGHEDYCVHVGGQVQLDAGAGVFVVGRLRRRREKIFIQAVQLEPK